MRTFIIAMAVVGSISLVAACSKLYSDHPTNLNGAPDASTYPPDDALDADTIPPDAPVTGFPDSGCGGGSDGGNTYPDGGNTYPDAGPCCNQPPDAGVDAPVAYPDAY